MDVTAVYAEHGDFVWRSLARLGVRPSDLRDMTQEVFVVVHKRFDSRDPSASLKSWLFGVCLRVASAYRRRAHRRHEHLVDTMADLSDPDVSNPETEASENQARAQLTAILDGMDLAQRAVFVMFEIDQMPCHEIASVLGCPVGTVHSRLRAARKSFEASLKRQRAREGQTVIR